MSYEAWNPESTTETIISPSVSHSRGLEPRAVKSIAKALDSRTLNMDIAGFFTAFELDEMSQNIVMEYFLACVKNWCEMRVDERDANFNTVCKAKIIRDAFIQMGQWYA